MLGHLDESNSFLAVVMYVDNDLNVLAMVEDVLVQCALQRYFAWIEIKL